MVLSSKKRRRVALATFQEVDARKLPVFLTILVLVQRGTPGWGLYVFKL